MTEIHLTSQKMEIISIEINKQQLYNSNQRKQKKLNNFTIISTRNIKISLCRVSALRKLLNFN